MKANVGGADRVLRIVVGLGVIGAGIYYHSWWGAIGAVFLATGLIRWCPLYCPLKLSTARREE